MTTFILKSLFLLFMCANLSFCLAEDGVSDKEIILGQSAALSGPTRELGLGMQAGLLASFSEINAKGRVKGKKIRLISLDDSYEPDKTVQNTLRLLHHDKVFLLIGNVGTPTSQASVPLILAEKVPFVAPFTGANFLSSPYNRYIINIRASYSQEIEKIVEYLVDREKFTRIACFCQSDGYGITGLSSVVESLGNRKMKPVAIATYERNTTSVNDGLEIILPAKPEAVIMVGAYRPASVFITMAKARGLKNSLFCNVSFVGAEALATQLRENTSGCIVSQVVDYSDTGKEIVKDFHNAMKRHQPNAKVDSVSMEGYLAGRFFCEIADRIKGEVTRENFIQTVEKVGSLSLGGIKLRFGENDNQGSDEVYLKKLEDGVLKNLEDPAAK